MHEPTEIDTAMKEFIATTEKEFAAEPVALPESDPAGGAPDEGERKEVSEQPNTMELERPVTDPAERGLERLVAREMELRERETAFAREKAETETLRARVRELESRQISEDLLNQIKLSPSSGLRTLGLDPDEVVRAALVEKLGDKVEDPQLREMMERNRLRREMEALKAEVQMAERQRAAQEFYSRVMSGANEFVRTPEALSKHAPTVAEVAKRSPDHVFAEIMEEITRDAQVRAAREPGGDILSYEEAAKRVEKRWVGLKSLLVPPSVVPASTPAPKTPAPEAKLPQNNVPSTTKPPDRPIAPWLQRNPDQEEAIRLALAEYTRVESQK